MNRLALKGYDTVFPHKTFVISLSYTKLKFVTYRISQKLCPSKLNQSHTGKCLTIMKLLRKNGEVAKDKK